MRNKLAILFGLTLASAAAVAGGKGFDELDRDGNGSLSKSEAAAAGVDFAAADSNGDGKLSQSEFEAAKSRDKGGMQY